MRHESMEDLVARVHALERQQRRWKAAFALVLVGVVGLGASGGKSRTVEAEEFVLKDASGAVRARLGLSSLIYALPADPSATPTDPLLQLDAKLDPPEPQIVEVSTSCLTFFAGEGQWASEQCTSWEPQGQTSMLVRVGAHTEYAVRANRDGAQVQIGQLRRKIQPRGRGRVVIDTFAGGASLRLTGPAKKRTAINTGSITITDESGRPPRVFPPDANAGPADTRP